MRIMIRVERSTRKHRSPREISARHATFGTREFRARRMGIGMVSMGTNWRKAGIGLIMLAPAVAGCGSATDFLSKDAEWFSRPARIFSGSTTMNSQPLSERGPVSPNDLINADGLCAEVAQSAPASDQSNDPRAAQPGGGGSVALESAECDVVRALGNPTNTSISGDERGQRLVVLTYEQGLRPGIYHFTGGRLTSIERGAEPPPAKKPQRQKSRRSTS
jgi:hypothetical protein